LPEWREGLCASRHQAFVVLVSPGIGLADAREPAVAYNDMLAVLTESDLRQDAL